MRLIKMDSTTLALLLFACVTVQATDVPQSPVETPDVAATGITEALRKEMMNSFDKNVLASPFKRQAEETNGEDWPKPELHFSTLRAETSGSLIPSPTMFIGGFSFMMMPTPEGEQIFNRIMESIPNFGSNK